ncbi:MAG: LemA family protein [Oscillospiraceae bacterium]|nr:LemA family protein [Oscillospiraceae bacterium]
MEWLSSYWWVIVIGIIMLMLIIGFIKTYNKLKVMQIKVNETLSGIEVALAKRHDMLIKMLDTAKGYMKHERETLIETIKFRKGMSISELNEASVKMDSVASTINAVAESYPELRSADVFKELQVGIRDVEQHLQAARRLYNSSVTSLNNVVAVVPSNIVAGLCGIKKEEFFVAEEYQKSDVKMSF